MCGDDKKRFGQRACLALGGDLVFLHRFEQRTLCFGGGAVDLVSEDHLRKDRPRMKTKTAVIALIDGHAEDIGRQQVAGELYALELQAQNGG